MFLKLTGRQINKCIFTCDPEGSGTATLRIVEFGNTGKNKRKKIGKCSVSLSASERHYPGQPRYGNCDETGQCSDGYPVHCQKCNEMCNFVGEPGTYERALITLSAITDVWFNKPIIKNQRTKGKLQLSKVNCIIHSLLF